MTDELILLEQREDIAWLTLNRPARRNALSLALLQALQSQLDEIAASPQIRAVVIASTGPVFSSGHDLSEMGGRTADQYELLFSTCTRVMQTLRQLPQPVIARVHGLATAAGCQLVAACDLVVASRESRFATPGVKIGLFCTTPMVPLVRAMSPKRALEMLLTGQPLTAEEACNAGLVSRVVAAEELDVVITEWTASIRNSSPATLALGKRAFYDQLNLPESEAYARATEIMIQNAVAPTAQEGIAAFLEKRPPHWPA